MSITHVRTTLTAIASAMIFSGAAHASILDGLVAYYPLDGHAQDLAGGFHGQVVNGATFGTGKVGQAVQLTQASKQYIGIGTSEPGSDRPIANFFGSDLSTPTSATDIGPDAYSYSVWFNVTGGSGARYILATRNSDPVRAGEQGFTLGARVDGNGTLSVFVQLADNPHGTGAYLQRTGMAITPTDDGWHHLLVTVERGTPFSVYLDGVLQTAALQIAGGGAVQFDVDSPLMAVDGLRIGGDQYDNAASSSRFFHGLIDELAIWDRVLTPSEIAFLYNNGMGNAIAIPEPMSLMLMGMSGVLLVRRRR